ncbi:Transmembrane emp24 domain-containing protein 10 (Protein Tmed10) (21 kDa transmembrane-trafficking protein) (Transmembrane protein Tmp21) (p24 family protein delta-1) (p24delta1) [Durusdinium trenchii]|uniref:Transmembrane emp24 domain-containing protein 10 (Protein Tmed10) (21 kDa transmembrane-trafficking protein) (Transmembrane protein Tmp21) (p24 family protein delta-1) (p24delta1) n=1 Tax=Durusdinium trenchii TaxID=1381693 RepID=A0ABP0QXN0_9DINO
MDDLPFGRPSSPPASVESSASAAPAAATAPASAPGLQLGRARCRHCMGRGADGLKDAALKLLYAALGRADAVDSGCFALAVKACGEAKQWERPAAWAILALLGPVASIKVSIHLPAREKKCFGEQAARLELLVVELSASEGSKVGVTVLSPHATIFSEHDRQQVKTAFTTQDAGPHWICIQNDEATDAEVLLSVLLGPEAKDYSQIAKKEHLEESKVTLRRVADALQNYHSNVLYIRAREERMRKTNDSTASRVIFFCLFNVVLMIGVGGWQMLYFKSFFRSKKII